MQACPAHAARLSWPASTQNESGIIDWQYYGNCYIDDSFIADKKRPDGRFFVSRGDIGLQRGHARSRLVAGGAFTWLTLVVIAPVLEEWTFRGWLFDTLRIYFNRHHWASTAQFSVISLHNLTTSALFVGLHILMRDVQTCLLVLLPSLVLGSLRDRRVSLVSLMGIHGLWNLGWFAIYSPG